MAYVYKHIRKDRNEVFYIGIGTQDKFKRAFSKIKRNDFWRNIASKTEYEVVIIYDGLTWEEACLKEIELISIYGRRDLGKGTLVNMTDGGDGSINVKHTTEWYERQKLNNNKKGKPISESHKKALVAFRNSPNYINGASKSIKVYKDSVIVGEYKCIKDAAIALKLKRLLIDRYLKGLSKKPRHNYHFEYI